MMYKFTELFRYGFIIIPILFIITYFIFSEYLFIGYYVACVSTITSCTFLYRFDDIVFIMHQKPTYFEKATVFKTNIINNDIEDQYKDKPEIKLIREVDTYLTMKFRRLFKHVLICVDSFMVGVLAYWMFLHFTTDESEYLVKNVGIFGGYVSLCSKAHIYFGKLILVYLKTNKDKVHKKEVNKRRKLSDEFFENNKGSIELTKIKESITNPMFLEEGYMDYFEMDFAAATRDFSEDEDDEEYEDEEEKEEREDIKREEENQDYVLDIDVDPPKSVMLVNKIRNIMMFKKPKDIGYSPNTIIIHY